MTILSEHGVFWWHNQTIPEKWYAPEASVGGHLEISDDGRISLELDDNMPSKGPAIRRWVAGGEAQPEDTFIQGILKGSNKHVLLMDLFSGGGQMSTNGPSFERYTANSCLHGHARIPTSDKAPEFPELRIPLTGFEEWLDLGAIEYTRTETEISARYSDPADISYALDDGVLTLLYDIRRPWGGDSPRRLDKLELKESAFLAYKPLAPLNLDAVYRHLMEVQDLLILLSESEHQLDWPHLRVDPEEPFYTLYFHRRDIVGKPPRALDCWMRFPELKETFGQIFLTWRKKRDAFGPAAYLYTGARRATVMYVEHRFVNLIWGLEAFHRQRFIVDEDTGLTRKIERIVETVGKSDKSWLRYKLKNAGEPSLQSRLFDIFKLLPLPWNWHNLRNFTKGCADTRNDLSHYGGPRSRIDYGIFLRELDKRSDALSCLYHILLLQEIGVSDDALKHQMLNGPRSREVRAQLKHFGLLDAPVEHNPRISAGV